MNHTYKNFSSQYLFPVPSYGPKSGFVYSLRSVSHLESDYDQHLINSSPVKRNLNTPFGSPDILVTDRQTNRQINKRMQVKTVSPACRQTIKRFWQTTTCSAIWKRLEYWRQHLNFPNLESLYLILRFLEEARSSLYKPRCWRAANFEILQAISTVRLHSSPNTQGIRRPVTATGNHMTWHSVSTKCDTRAGQICRMQRSMFRRVEGHTLPYRAGMARPLYSLSGEIW